MSKIEWTDKTANPVRGRCPVGCNYCYAEAMRKRFKKSPEITYHPEVLEAIERGKKPATIFMGSAFDLFGKRVKASIHERISTTIDKRADCDFIFLTKNPHRYIDLDLINDKRVWHGATVDTQKRGKSYDGAWTLFEFISFEPLLEDVAEYINLWHIQGIIIGAQTGPGAVVPKREWVMNLLAKADEYDAKVFIKNNLFEIYPDLPMRRELLWPLHTKSPGA